MADGIGRFFGSLTWGTISGVAAVLIVMGALIKQIRDNEAGIARIGTAIERLVEVDNRREPQLTAILLRLASLEDEFKSGQLTAFADRNMAAALQGRMASLESEHARIERELETKVPEKVRLEMLTGLLNRLTKMDAERQEILDQIERLREHIMSIDRRTQSMRDDSSYARAKRDIGPGYDPAGPP